MIDAYPRTAPAENARSLRLTPVGILCAFIAFLFVLPSNLIVGPLGADIYWSDSQTLLSFLRVF